MENVNQYNLDAERLRKEIESRKIREEDQKEELEKYIKEVQSIPDLTIEEQISLFKQIIIRGKEILSVITSNDYLKINDLLFGLGEGGEYKPAEKLFQSYRKFAILILEHPMKIQKDIVLKNIYVDNGLMTTLAAVELAEDSIRYAIRDFALRKKMSDGIKNEEEKNQIELQGFKIIDMPEIIFEKVDRNSIELFRDYLEICVYNGLHGFSIMRKRHLGLRV